MRELRWVAVSVVCCLSAVVGVVHAGEVVPNPYAPTGVAPLIDFSNGPIPSRPVDSGVRFEDLDAYMNLPETTLPEDQVARPGLPEGWVQVDDMIVPRAVAEGADVRSPSSLDQLHNPPRPSRGKVMGPSAADLCAFPEATPDGIYNGEFHRGSEYPRRGTIYMNYTGGKLVNGGENSAENMSTLAKTGSTYPVYGGGEAKAVAVAQAVQTDFAELAVRVVYLKRPPKRLPYVMIMMGGSYKDTTSGPAGGVAPGADCEDSGLRNVCYAFVKGSAATDQSNVASQEIGHTMGLGHTYGKDRVMAYGYDTNSNIDMGFGDVCSTVYISTGQAGYCAGVNKCHCASDGKQQHDLRTLKAIYAPPGPDMIPPTISITSPADGASFLPSDLITVEVDPSDDYGGYGWDITVTDSDDKVLAEIVDYQIAQQFNFKGLPPGVYTITARVQDHSDQIGEHAIKITIEGEENETGAPTTSDSESDGGSEAGSDGGSSSGGGSSGDSDATAGEATDDGCSCRNGRPDAALALWAVPALLGLRRRKHP